jgi:hypothetical protein
MFILWAAWWTYAVFHAQLVTQLAAAQHRQQQSPSRKAGRASTTTATTTFHGRTWYPWPLPPAPAHLEPIAKVFGPLLGVAVELYLGFGFKRRVMFVPDGHFAAFHVNNWQHALMYGAFCLSGVVDLLGHYLPPGALPPGTEQAFLSLAFLAETLLMGLHAKHDALDKLVHALLTWVMLACVAVTAAEAAAPRSFLLAALRPAVVMLQGTWFCQVGAILYGGEFLVCCCLFRVCRRV